MSGPHLPLLTDWVPYIIFIISNPDPFLIIKHLVQHQIFIQYPETEYGKFTLGISPKIGKGQEV